MRLPKTTKHWLCSLSPHRTNEEWKWCWDTCIIYEFALKLKSPDGPFTWRHASTLLSYFFLSRKLTVSKSGNSTLLFWISLMGMDCKKVNKISLVPKENMAGQSEYYTCYIFGQKALIPIGQRVVNCENTLSLHCSNELSTFYFSHLLDSCSDWPCTYSAVLVHVESHSLLLKPQVEATYM